MRRLPVLCLLSSFGAAAQAQDVEGVYLGAALGWFQYSEEIDDSGFRVSDSTGAYRLLGGYQFNENYAIEAAWGATEDLEETFRAFDPMFGGDITLTIKQEYEIAMVRFLAFAPLSQMSIFGGIGYYDSTTDVLFRLEDDFGVQTATDQNSDNGAMVIGGLQFERDRITLRGEYEWLDAEGNVDATTVSFAVLFRF